jgi:WD40 repeat protein/uncharacterized caspase-like protein
MRLILSLALLCPFIASAAPKSLSEAELVIQSAGAAPSSIAVTPDGQLIAGGRVNSGGTVGSVDLIDFRSNRLIRRILVAGQVSAVAFTPDGQHVAALHTGSAGLQLWEVATGKLVASAPRPDGQGGVLTVSGDGRTIASITRNPGDPAFATVWRYLTKQPPKQVKFPPEAFPNRVALNANGSLLAVEMNDGIHFFSTESGSVPVRSAIVNVLHFEFNTDGSRLYVAARESERLVLAVIDPVKGQRLATLKQPIECDEGTYSTPVSDPARRVCLFALTPRVKAKYPMPENQLSNASSVYPTNNLLLPDGLHSLRRVHSGKLWLFDELRSTGAIRDTPMIGGTAQDPIFTGRGEILLPLMQERVATLWDLASGRRVASHHTYDSDSPRFHPIIYVSPKGGWVLKYGGGKEGDRLEAISLTDASRSHALDVLKDPIDETDDNTPFVDPCFDAAETKVGVYRTYFDMAKNKSTSLVEVWDLVSRQKTGSVDLSKHWQELEPHGLATCAFDGDAKLPRLIAIQPSVDPPSSVASPDGKRTAKICGERLERVCVDGSPALQTAAHASPIRKIRWSADGRFLATTDLNRVMRLWDAKTGLLRATLLWNSDGWAVVTPDNFYMTSQGEPEALALAFGNRAVPLGRFDAVLNRPDLVITTLGGPKELAELYAKARAKRARKASVDEAKQGNLAGVPELALEGEPALLTEERMLPLALKASSSSALSRLHVTVNGIPVFGSAGLDISAAGTEFQRRVEVPLAPGPNSGDPGHNLVLVTVTDAEGRESIPLALQVACLAPIGKPDLYVLSVGVSKYAQDALDLRYAAKDARDVETSMKQAVNRRAWQYNTVKTMLLTDKQVTREGLLKARDFLAKAKSDDVVVVFLAGHGLLDEQLDYYFATHDIDPNEPSKRGVPFAELDGLVDGIAARRRVVLMDTCHAGEVDKETTVAEASRTVPHTNVSARGLRGVKRKSDVSTNYAQIAADGFFADLRRRSGATILGSSSGTEYALESSKWKNGVFTFALQEGLQGRRASRNFGPVDIASLMSYVTLRVENLTSGQQHPSARQVSGERFTIHPGIDTSDENGAIPWGP